MTRDRVEFLDDRELEFELVARLAGFLADLVSARAPRDLRVDVAEDLRDEDGIVMRVRQLEGQPLEARLYLTDRRALELRDRVVSGGARH